MGAEYLTSEERTIIQSFIENGVLTNPLIELKNRKSAELLQCLDSLVPCQSVTWRKLIAREDDTIDCPLNDFLITFENLLNDPELQQTIEKRRRYPSFRDERLSLLEKLDVDFKEHKYPCKICCPAN